MKTKRVRFETPTKTVHHINMNDFDCQSPRPFTEKKLTPRVLHANYGFAEFSNDPLQRYENSNCSPYPIVYKTSLAEVTKTEPKWSPSNDLELSILDSCKEISRTNHFHESYNCLQPIEVQKDSENKTIHNHVKSNSRVLTSLENNYPNPPNFLSKHDDFFLRRDNLRKLHDQSVLPIDSQLKKMCLDKENNPLAAKIDLMRQNTAKPLTTMDKMANGKLSSCVGAIHECCKMFHCMSRQGASEPCRVPTGPCLQCMSPKNLLGHNKYTCKPHSMSNLCASCTCNFPVCKKYSNNCLCSIDNSLPKDTQTQVDKKSWALEKYEESQSTSTLDIEKHGIVKEKREPTVADLFKIIKLQNEQLKLLQDKVDKFVSSNKFEAQKQPLPLERNYRTEHMSVASVDKECHKISIGVMTSFEMVRTSTIINKEIVKQSSEAQIQCNRSQISMKEIIQPENINFLDGIRPVAKNNNFGSSRNVSVCESNNMQHSSKNFHQDNANEEKTLNELSLYNVQVDNAITPLMSPEQSLYLDVKDYSDSGSECEDQSNVGWTYYNKVMTHVNGMLHDSDMPSSASAMYRNTRQKCMQMKIDKTNVSVIKRVKFGDDPVGKQPHVPSTDTSLKMNQLAAKYLKNETLSIQQETQKAITAPNDVSLATRNYMEKHQLLQGFRSKPVQAVEIPRFLDITALKQQTKLL